MQLIGLTGQSGAGKNTAADYLEKPTVITAWPWPILLKKPCRSCWG